MEKISLAVNNYFASLEAGAAEGVAVEGEAVAGRSRCRRRCSAKKRRQKRLCRSKRSGEAVRSSRNAKTRRRRELKLVLLRETKLNSYGTCSKFDEAREQ